MLGKTFYLGYKKAKLGKFQNYYDLMRFKV